MLAMHGPLPLRLDLASAWALCDELEHAASMQLAVAALGGLKSCPPWSKSALKP
ncbi:hypothetical protein DFAR_340043 [Desulfarculales bacterium]